MTDEVRRQPAETCVVLMLGYPGVGKRTVGRHLADLLGGVLIDNALINRPILELFQWDGVELLPREIWDYVAPIRRTVLQAIEEIAPPTTSYVFTKVLEDEPGGAAEYATLRALADRRGSVFLAVLLTCELDTQVSRIDAPDRVALRKGSDPEGYRVYTLSTALFAPPDADVLRLDTTRTPPGENAERILAELRRRGFDADGG